MRSWMAFLALVPACGFNSDAKTDGGIDTPEVQRCFGSYTKVCFTTAADIPTTPKTLSADIDTAGPACDTHNDKVNDYCVIAAAGLTLPAATTVRAFGTKPLILLSTAAVDLAGTLDLSSRREGPNPTGAGADPTGGCTGSTPPDQSSGGFGGSFGGKGGDGEAVGALTPVGGKAAAALTSFPATLRGGCPGGNGSAPLGMTAGAGGSGGGAVLIIAQSIQVNGTINASGSGGRGGPPAMVGGGGGGSGGMIVLDAATLTGTGLLFANGGGGGQGGAAPSGGGMGHDGGESMGPSDTAVGGLSGSDGGAGGVGAARTRLEGYIGGGSQPAQNQGGGGAGGGGAGFVHAPGLTTAMIAPPTIDP